MTLFKLPLKDLENYAESSISEKGILVLNSIKKQGNLISKHFKMDLERNKNVLEFDIEKGGGIIFEKDYLSF